MTHRNALLMGMSPPQGIDAALRIADADRDAQNLGDLIKHAETAAENSAKQRQRTRAGGLRKKSDPLLQADDPTRPGDLRSLAPGIPARR